MSGAEYLRYVVSDLIRIDVGKVVGINIPKKSRPRSHRLDENCARKGGSSRLVASGGPPASLGADAGSLVGRAWKAHSRPGRSRDGRVDQYS